MLNKCRAAKTSLSLLLSSIQGASTPGLSGAGWGWDASACSGGLHRAHRGEPGRGAHNVHSPCPPSTQTSRAPSSCRRTAPSLTMRRAQAPRWLWPQATWWMSWRRARVVSLPALPGPPSPGAWAHGYRPPPRLCPPGSPRPPPRLAHRGALAPSGALTVLPTLWVTLSESVPQGSSGDLHTFWAVTVHLWGLYPGGQVNFSPCV